MQAGFPRAPCKSHLLRQKHIDLIEVPFPFIGPYSNGYSFDRLMQWRRLIADNAIDQLVICTGASTIYEKLISPDYQADDAFQPMKGVVAHIKVKPSRASIAHLYEGSFFKNEALYIVPLVDRYVLGGTIHSVSRTADDDGFWQVNESEKLGIIERAKCFLPRAYQKILERSGVFNNADSLTVEWRAGVRPFLNAGPRVEYSETLSEFLLPKPDTKLGVYLHYGHGGSGFTMCHDTADIVVNKLKLIDD